MNQVNFNYRFYNLQELLDKYIAMVDLIEQFIENKPYCEYNIEIEIGEKEHILRIYAKNNNQTTTRNS